MANYYFELDEITNAEFDYLVEELKTARGILTVVADRQLRRLKVTPTDNDISAKTILSEIKSITSDRSLRLNISGMTCSACTDSVRSVLDRSSIASCIKSKNVSIAGDSFFTLRPGTNPEEIERLITDATFTVERKTFLPTNTSTIKAWHVPVDNESEQQLFFSMQGLQSAKDAEEIAKRIEEIPYVHSCTITYSTKSVIVKFYAKPEQSTIPGQSIVTRFEGPIQEALMNAMTDIETARANNRTRIGLPTIPVSDPSRANPSNVKVYTVKPPLNMARPVSQTKRYFQKALLNLVFGLPLLLLSAYIPLPLTIFGQLFGFALGGLTLGLMWKTGKEYYINAWRKFKNEKSFDMNALIAIGTIAAFISSMLIVFVPGLFPLVALQYKFLAVNMILGIVNFGRGVRSVAQEEAQKKVKSIEEDFMSMQPQRAKRVVPRNANTFDFRPGNYTIEDVDFKDLVTNDLFVMENGESCPNDGVIVSAPEDVFISDENFSGESGAGNRKIGDEINSGSNVKMPHGLKLIVRSTCNGRENKLIRQLEQVARASSTETSISKTVDTIAKYMVPAILAIATLTFAGWLIFGPVGLALAMAIDHGLSVTMIICPCSVALSYPIAQLLCLLELLKMGIHVKDASVIDAAASMNVVGVDKTGTVTLPSVANIHISQEARINGQEVTEEMIFEYVASIEKHEMFCNHPYAHAFTNKVSSLDNLQCAEPAKHEQGVSGIVRGSEVLVGSLAHLRERGVQVPQEFIEAEARNDRADGMTSMYVAIDKRCVSVVGLQHEVLPKGIQMIRELREKYKIKVYLVTGDKFETAYRQAEQLGIDPDYVVCERLQDVDGFILRRDREGNFRNRTDQVVQINRDQQGNLRDGNNNIIIRIRITSAHKVAWIRQLQKKGNVVGFIGDGVNDQAAMEVADVGMDVGPETFAHRTSKVSIRNLDVPKLILVSRQTMHNIYQNLLWAALYNVLSLIAATGILYWYIGLAMNPILAATAMAFSSIFVVLNSTTLSSKIQYEIEKDNNPRIKPMSLVDQIKSHIKNLGVLFKLKKPDETKKSANQETPASVQGYPIPDGSTPEMLAAFRNAAAIKEEPILSSQATTELRRQTTTPMATSF